MSESHSWARLPDEPSRWFSRFERFRLAGPGRSINAIYNAERVAKGRQESRQSSGAWRESARVWRWLERAQAWDQRLADEAEARWKAAIMGPSEVLARLSEEGRANPYDFFKKVPVPFQTPDGQIVKDKDGNVIMADTWGLNEEALKARGHLIKSISWTAQGPKIELYNSQEAKVHMGRHHKLFTDKMDLTSNGETLKDTNAGLDRALSTLADALRETLSGADAGKESDLAAAKQAPVAGPPVEGG